MTGRRAEMHQCLAQALWSNFDYALPAPPDDIATMLVNALDAAGHLDAND
jgi:hypothetical protein